MAVAKTRPVMMKVAILKILMKEPMKPILDFSIQMVGYCPQSMRQALTHFVVETGESDENTVFSSRASLYVFKEGAWKEGGKGTIKLNVKSSGGEQGAKSGRFIMRAHQTFRVLLNAPVLKGMAIGDRGAEPNGKSFQFAAIDNGKVVPHLLKVGGASVYRFLR